MTHMPTDVAPASREQIRILGVPVDVVTMSDAMAKLETFVASGKPHFVITADASSIVQAQTDPDLKALYDRADLVTPDSAGVLWASPRFGHKLTERVSGVDMVDHVCALSAEKGYRVYFLGAAPGIAELAAERMRLRYPGCHIVGARHGYFPAESDTVIAEEVAKENPDFLFVAMGIPRQEKFILATQKIIGARVAMGVGGSLDVFSGTVKRAPKLMQKMRLEWAWRFMLNPKKIGKVMLLPKFIGLVLRSKR
ncbi:glycosyltransferase [bacterium]|nr:MAG: glycosyltransferase [bacterium]